MKFMKIVEIINELQQRGGAEVFVTNLCHEFAKREDNEIVLISLFDKPHPTFVNKIDSSKITFLTLGKRKGLDFSAARKMKKILKNLQPDVVHLHLSCLSTYFIAFGLKKQKWQLYQTFHSIPGSTSNGIHDFIRMLFIKKKLITFVGISDEITKIAKQKYKNICCLTIYNGIDLRHPFVNPAQHKRFDLIIVASFRPAKNHLLLFNAIDSLSDKYDVSLLCVGDGPLRQNYLKLTSPKIKMVGYSDDVYKYLLDSKIFVLSSLREGNPISILEAMDCGLPIIAPKIGGIPDVVINNKNGLLFEANNKKELCDAIIYFLENPKEIEIIGRRNAEYVRKYSMDICSSQYYDLFENKH